MAGRASRGRSALRLLQQACSASVRLAFIASASLVAVLFILSQELLGRKIRTGNLQNEALGLLVAKTDMMMLRIRESLRNGDSFTLVIAAPPDSSNAYLQDLYEKALTAQVPSVRFERGCSLRSRIALVGIRSLAHMSLRSSFYWRFHLGAVRMEGIEGIGIANSGRPYVRIVPNEQARRTQLLRAIGLDPTRPYVCLAMRDSAYWQQRASGNDRIAPYAHRTEDASSFRSVNQRNYTRGVDWLTSAGYQVVLMGVRRAVAFDYVHDSFIDYSSSSYRSDENDCLLFAGCEFGLFGGSSGIAGLAATFNKPVVICDFRPLTRPSYSTTWSVVTPSLLVDQSGRYVPLEAMVRVSSDVALSYSLRGWRFIDNSPDDIVNAIQCAHDRLRRGRFLSSIEGEHLERRFWEIHDSGRSRRSRVPNGHKGSWLLKDRFKPETLSLRVENAHIPEAFLVRYRKELGLGKGFE